MTYTVWRFAFSFSFLQITIVSQETPHYLLQSSEVPERLSGRNTWNCSVRHWPRFKRHFRCNLRQECIGREDEERCPYSSCRRGGVSFGHRCYFFIENVERIHWLDAQQQCRKKGANLVSMTSPREWSDVVTWIHLHMPEERHQKDMIIYVGVTSAPPTLPYMWVENVVKIQGRG